MGITVEDFGTLATGEMTHLYTITNKKGNQVAITDFGGIIVKIIIKDKDGNPKDVVLGFDKVKPYTKDVNCYGAIVGPIANRTAGAAFAIGDKKYKLEVNDGVNNLHTSAKEGFQKRLWKAKKGKDSITLTLLKKDKEMGHPGKMHVAVTYTFTDKDELIISYESDTDKETVINMTNHTYFALNGHDDTNILHERLWINADNYTPIHKGGIPTGKIAKVKGTPMDFTNKEGREVCEKFTFNNKMIEYCNGYDINMVLNNYNGKNRLVATLWDDVSHIKMDTYTDLPGIQFYTGNWVGEKAAKGKVPYGPRQGLCLETQFYPNVANEKNFPQAVYGPKKAYKTTTTYAFSIFK